MKLLSLKQFDIEALKQQGADLNIEYKNNIGLPLDFSRGYDGYDIYEVIIDNKYKGHYQRRYKTDDLGKHYIDKKF